MYEAKQETMFHDKRISHSIIPDQLENIVVIVVINWYIMSSRIEYNNQYNVDSIIVIASLLFI